MYGLGKSRSIANAFATRGDSLSHPGCNGRNPHAILAGKSTSTNRSSLAKPRDFFEVSSRKLFSDSSRLDGPGPQGRCLRSPQKKIGKLAEACQVLGENKKKAIHFAVTAQSNHPNKHDLGVS